MTTIVEGMTPAEFIIAMNSNFADIVAGYVTIAETMTGVELQEALNSNYSDSDTYIGSGFINKLNSNFVTYNVSLNTPTGLDVSWIEDYAHITFTDTNSGNCQHEIWEKRDDADYVLAYTINAAVELYDYFTWQGSELQYRVRAKNGSLYSPFSTAKDISTPLVIKTNQSTLSQILIKLIKISPGGSINIDWGDGTDNDFLEGSTSDFTKDYIVENSCYFITISGDLDLFTMLDWVDQPHLFGDLTKWRLPPLGLFHFYGNTNVTGDISNWELRNAGIFHIGSCDFYGDLTNLVIPSTAYDFRLDGNRLTGDLSELLFPMDNGHTLFYFTCADNEFTGDISGWIYPNNMVQLNVSGNYFTGDLSGWIIPDTLSKIVLSRIGIENNNFSGDLSGWIFPETESLDLNDQVACPNMAFSGDLSGWNVPARTRVFIFDFTNNNLSKLPRGNFEWVSEYVFTANNCSSQEIDDILTYIDNYFVDGVVPLTDCTYTLNGTDMGIPSATGLAAKASIEGKYTAAGKTATITVNT